MLSALVPQTPISIKWAFVVSTLLGVSIVFHLGFNISDPTFMLFVHAKKYYEAFAVDPLMKDMLPSVLPLAYKLAAPVIDIPFFHLVSGACLKILLVAIYFCIAWKITGNLFASTVATTIMFGLAYLRLEEYYVFNLRFPTGLAGNELRINPYFSFRQVGMFFSLIALFFFLQSRFVLCSLLMVLAHWSHSVNTINFFLCFSGALILCCLIKKRKIPYLVALLKLAVPFSICTLPYIMQVVNILDYVEPINFNLFWNVAAQNEADDATLLYYLNFHKATIFSWLLMTIIASLLYLLCISKKPIQRASLNTAISETNDVLFPLFLSVLAIFCFAVMWESTLIPLLPDFLNTAIASLNLRRSTTMSSIISIVIIGMFLSRGILLLARALVFDSRGSLPSAKPGILLGDTSLSLLLLLFVVVNTFFIDGKNSNLLSQIKNQSIKDFLVFDHKDYKHFRKLSSYTKDSPAYTSSLGVVIPYSALHETCSWVLQNTDISAAFIQPTYISQVRACSLRQNFLSVHYDGILAAFNRKYATLYLERFTAIHKGMTYAQLPGLSSQGAHSSVKKRPAYESIRKKYLSIDESDLEKIKRLYPGYSYFLTESSHELSYPVAYQNDYFTLYSIVNPPSD